MENPQFEPNSEISIIPFHHFEIFFHEIFFLDILKLSTLHFYGQNLFKMTYLEESQEKL